MNSERVFILGPSHRVYLQACALSRCETYQTPLGDLTLDREGTIESAYYNSDLSMTGTDIVD